MLKGDLKGCDVMILIDSGSNHNFCGSRFGGVMWLSGNLS